jgi:hypothetical protein
VAVPLAVKPTVAPEHIVDEDGVTVTVGKGYMVMSCVAVAVHPPTTVPVTVYVVVTVGVATT